MMADIGSPEELAVTGHAATTPATTAPTTRHRAQDRRRRVPVRAIVLVTGVVMVVLAGATGRVSGLVALPVTGVLVAALAADRPVALTRRTMVVAGLALLGYAGVLVFAPGVFVVPALLLVVSPLALPTGTTMVTTRDLVLSVAGALTLTLAHLSGRTALVLAVTAAGLPVLLAARLLRRRPAARRAYLVRALTVLVFAALLAATTLPGTYDTLALTLPGGVFTVRTAIVAGAVAAAALAFVPGGRVLPAATALLAAASMYLAFELAATYREPADPVTLRAPFVGDWYIVHGGHSALVNGYRSESLDLIQVNDGSSHNGAGVSDYYAFDQPLLAPTDGTVVYVSDGLPDRTPSTPDPDPAHAAGNQIVLDLGGGRYLHLAHLEHGSALVNVGDRVTREHAVARVGNSGDSAEPHVHIEVRDSPDPGLRRAGVRTFPIRFTDVVVTRGGHTSLPAAVDLRRGDHIQSHFS